MTKQPIHGTVVARHGPDGWRAAVLRGPSGAGKSDMALRLIDAGWRLIADDYAHVWVSGGRLHACAARTIEGRIEARGLGVLSMAWRPSGRVWLLVDCVRETVERLPEPVTETVAGIAVPRLALDIRPASATVILRHAIDRL